MSQLAAPREGLMPGSSGGEELHHAGLETIDETTPEIRIEGIKTDVVALCERLRYCTEQERKRRGARVFDVERA